MDLHLEDMCPVCFGSGWLKLDNPGLLSRMLYDGKEKCTHCSGKGYELTATGEYMVKFMVRHVTTGSIDDGGLCRKGTEWKKN